MSSSRKYSARKSAYGTAPRRGLPEEARAAAPQVLGAEVGPEQQHGDQRRDGELRGEARLFTAAAVKRRRSQRRDGELRGEARRRSQRQQRVEEGTPSASSASSASSAPAPLARAGAEPVAQRAQEGDGEGREGEDAEQEQREGERVLRQEPVPPLHTVQQQ